MTRRPTPAPLADRRPSAPAPDAADLRAARTSGGPRWSSRSKRPRADGPRSASAFARRIAALLVAALSFAAPSAPSFGQDAPPPAGPAAGAARAETTAGGDVRGASTEHAESERAERRRRVAAAAGADALVVVFAPALGDAAPGSNRNSDFVYLAPVEAREAALVLGLGRAPAGAPAETTSEPVDRLYLPVRNPAGERWTGPEPGPGPETAAETGFASAHALDRLADDVAALLRDRRALYVSAGPSVCGGPAFSKWIAQLRERLPGRWVRLVDAPGAGRDDIVESLRRALPARLPDAPPDESIAKLDALDVRSARTLIGTIREVKSASEIASIRRAVAATVAGHADAIRAVRAGLFEYHVAAIVEMRCREGGCRRQAYPSIAGAGPNSCVLHYDRNRRRLEDGDLVVLDAGGEHDGYACDVTRTFPVSGKFTPEQAAAYDAVLEAQVAAIGAVRPGATLRDVHDVARGVLERHGLAKWFIHGTCHAVGLDVHDPWRRDAPLRPGCVLTVEPGMYDPARNLGIRIEDTVLVTESGCEVLSAALPKGRAEIEALAAEDPPPGLPR